MRIARSSSLIFVVGWLIIFAAPAYAQTEGGALRKMGRGFANLATGWLELPFQVARSTERSGAWAGSTVGLTRGVAFGIGRTLMGALELISFPIPNPTTGYGPIIKPEFVTFRDADRW